MNYAPKTAYLSGYSQRRVRHGPLSCVLPYPPLSTLILSVSPLRHFWNQSVTDPRPQTVERSGGAKTYQISQGKDKRFIFAAGSTLARAFVSGFPSLRLRKKSICCGALPPLSVRRTPKYASFHWESRALPLELCKEAAPELWLLRLFTRTSSWDLFDSGPVFRYVWVTR